MYLTKDSYDELTIKSKVMPIWSVKSYSNGYFYFLTADKKQDGYPRGDVPLEVREELDPIAQARMK